MREACSVHSEHTKNIAQDNWRFSQIKRLLSEPGHAYSKFGTGNTDTLIEIPKSKGIDVREVSQKSTNIWMKEFIQMNTNMK
jgi:insulysin